MREFFATTWLALAVLNAPAGVLAQSPGPVRLMGEVRHVENEQPVVGAAVRLLELELVAVTDRNGFFSFDSIPPGVWTFEASQFGFVTNLEASEIGERSFLLIRLAAAPIAIEGLYVSVLQRLHQRRLAVPSRVVAWDKPDLENAISPDIGSFVRTRGVAQFVRCGGEFAQTDLPNCFLRKGRPARLRLFIDDVQMMNAQGTMNLWAYDPRDLWSVEFLPGCATLRIYTTWFMEQVEAGRVRMAHVICPP